MRIAGNRVTSALLDMPRKMSVRGLIAAMPMIIQRQNEQSAFRDYMAMCAFNVNEIVAKRYGGAYMTTKYHDVINPPKEETRTSEEVINEIKEKLNALGGD